MVLEGNQLRKIQHINVVARENVEGPLTTFFEYVFLVHNASSEVSITSVDLRTRFLGKTLEAPIVITGMTGGAPGTEKINRGLAELALKYRVGLGLGSQRAALEEPGLEYTFKIARSVAPEIPIIANIGAAEAVKLSIEKIERAVEMIEADAIAIHLNLAQELVQLEGSKGFTGLRDRVAELKEVLSVPIIIKEVGNGLSFEAVKTFYDLGIRYFDTAGAGGTNWVKVEMFRAIEAGNDLKRAMAENMVEWGIPTAASIIEARSAAPNAFIIGSGGIRSAFDAVKALRLGADVVGMARPVLMALLRGDAVKYLGAFIESMKALLALTGSYNVSGLRHRPVIITGMLREWVVERGLKVVNTLIT